VRKVAVVFGGRSCENEISVLTGVFALNVLDREAYQLLPIYVHTDGGFYTSPKMFSVDTFRGGGCEKFQRIFFGFQATAGDSKGTIRIPLLI
jgi:D-alanine-D-alanine ligase-like ATP-grasp enzyme